MTKALRGEDFMLTLIQGHAAPGVLQLYDGYVACRRDTKARFHREAVTPVFSKRRSLMSDAEFQSQSSTTTSPEAAAEQPVSEVREMLLPWEKALKETKRKIRSFYLTRRKFTNGIPLYDWVPAEISASGLQTPLRFHLYQTVLSAIPSTAILQIWSFIHPLSPDDFDTPSPSLGDIHFSFWARLLNPTMVPVILLIFASVVSWASLRRRDSSRISRARARRAAHYLAATYNFYPAMFISIGFISIPIIMTASVSETTKWAVGIAVAAVCFLFILRTVWVTGFLFPDQLFRINGYGVVPVKTSETTWDYVNPPPRLKFRVIWFLFGLLGSTLIMGAYSLLISALAYASSTLQARLIGTDYY